MTNAKEIWDYLMKQINNPYGVAAIMGNLMAESSLNPASATGKNKTADYIKDADSGVIDFANDGVAFGLAQWCYHTRKQGLIDLAKLCSLSVGDLYLQLEYLIKEMSGSYKTVWNAVLNATNIREASDIVMLKYEKPANTSDTAKKKRADYGQKFFDQYASIISPTKNKSVYITAKNVNLRIGNGLKYDVFAKAQTGDSFPWIATAENGWHGVLHRNRVLWVSPDFSELKG